MDVVLLEKHPGWCELILNRPDRKNAVEGTLASALKDAIAQIEEDQDIRAVVLRGAGGAFCSGLDTKAFSAEPKPDWVAGWPSLWESVHTALVSSKKVWLVALERYAINGGAALALAGDLMVCGRSAFLQVGEISIGMAAPRIAAWLALRHSEAVAARLCLTAERIPADDLVRLGIGTECVEDDQVLARTRERATAIAAFPANAVAAVKSGMRAATLHMPPAAWSKACTEFDVFGGKPLGPVKSNKSA
ncbi:enoyl-CoA hydratase/isomerase family protein [Pseudorhodoferax soli]|uniref:Enoyl-CoA hydratase/carnithine racemase n=1 Tax=Pseudorhodoferax soli TaxID=545864 RepID=A0A368X7F6_9BURK|nr:enoyl-CoA hydratase/isomerase family protein [Pseudorhodoferax soli]RCW63619.1 enoyl-CoA hydratase/carnithine racemase [Pseudorhodoferax soli]